MADESVSLYFRWLRDEVPSRFLEKILQIQPLVYEEAFSRTYHDPLLDEPEAHDLCGHQRHALFQTKLAAIAAECGFSCHALRNRRRTSHYRVVRIGRFLLTASAVHNPRERPRAARFRRQHAALNHALAFPTFDFMPEADLLDGEQSVYGIILHGPEVGEPNRPGFLRIGLPDVPCRSWLENVPVESLLIAQKATRAAEGEKILDLAKPRKKRKEGNQ